MDDPGAVVRIQGLRFVRPVSRAIHVGSAMEAVVANCVIEAVEPVTIGDAVFGIAVGGVFESPINRLVVVDNTIADSNEPVEAGIILAPSSRVAIGSIAIYRNNIRATAHGIDLRDIGGNAQINHNRIRIDNSDRTGDAPFRFVDGIRCLGAGACSIVGNRIESHHPNSSGVRLQAAAGAIVEDNSIQMTPPRGLTPGAQSSGVQLIDDSKRNLVGRNRVSGAALTAFSISGPLRSFPRTMFSFSIGILGSRRRSSTPRSAKGQCGPSSWARAEAFRISAPAASCGEPEDGLTTAHVRCAVRLRRRAGPSAAARRRIPAHNRRRGRARPRRLLRPCRAGDRGSVIGAAARVFQGQVVGMRGGGSGFAPVRIGKNCCLLAALGMR